MDGNEIYKLNDWRIMGQPGYLFGKRLYRTNYVNLYECAKSHAHCEFCFDILSANDNDLHEGYYEPNTNSWICDSCFNDFKVLFNWTIGGNFNNNTGDGSVC